MLYSAIDPALLIYDEEHWRTEQEHFFKRLGALDLHRNFLRQYGLGIITSDEISSILFQSFPWNTQVNELHDLRRFLFEDWPKAKRLEPKPSVFIALEPDDLTCRFVDDPGVLTAWKDLLHSCVKEQQSSELDFQVATWEADQRLGQIQEFTVTVDSEIHYLPLVWNEETWARQLAPRVWPNLNDCVKLYFLSNPAIRSYEGVRENPIAFEWTQTFWDSVEEYCQQDHLRRALIEAVAKRVYGVLDASLGDEPFMGMRRFRVTDFWRVHYRDMGDSLLLEEFGPHDIGM